MEKQRVVMSLGVRGMRKLLFVLQKGKETSLSSGHQQGHSQGSAGTGRPHRGSRRPAPSSCHQQRSCFQLLRPSCGAVGPSVSTYEAAPQGTETR